MNYQLLKASTDEHFEAIKALLQAYQNELKRNLSFQQFDEELNDLRKIYVHDKAAIFVLLNEEKQTYAACVGLKEIQAGICEMKRLYVAPAFRQKGYGQVLTKHIIEEGRQMGFKSMVLDTLEELKPAIRLYKKLGFKEIEAYNDNPFEDVIFMRLDYSPST